MDLNSFFETLKEGLLHEEIPLSSIPMGTTVIRPVSRRGDDNVVPFIKKRVHFVNLGKNKKTPIFCNGRNCDLCGFVNEDYSARSDQAASMRNFMYDLTSTGKVRILSVPDTFITALFGDIGAPGLAILYLKKGRNIFSVENGCKLKVFKEVIEGQAFWKIDLIEDHSLNENEYDNLMMAPPLRSAAFQLNDQEMSQVRRKLEGLPHSLPKKLGSFSAAS